MASGPKGRKPASNKADAISLDWEAIRSCVKEIESAPESKDPATRQRYVRMQRLVRKHGSDNEMRDAVFGIASEFCLSSKQAILLFLGLSRLKLKFEFSKWFAAYPADGATEKEIKGIRNSLSILSSFAKSESRAKDRALKLIETAANDWAETQDAETLESLGIEHIRASDGSTVSGSQYVISQWLKFAPFMHDFVKIVLERPREASPTPLFPSGPTAIISLVGNDLPALYQNVVGKKFTVSRATPAAKAMPGKVRDITGVRFVRMSAKAITGKDYATETIASHESEYTAWLKSLGNDA